MRKLVSLILFLCIFFLGCSYNILNVEETTLNDEVPAEEPGEEIVEDTSEGGIPDDNDTEAEAGVESGNEESEPSEEEEGSEIGEAGPETHTVDIITGGFALDSITIEAGDSVVWKNEREGRITKALLIGVRECASLRSGVFNPGEVYKYQFNKPMTCMIADGIYTKQGMRVIVE